ncbi:MAG: hypothetical protein ACREKL_12180, partial [Chthoniobacterales bacterium]
FEPLSPGTKLTEKQKKQVEQVQNEFATNSGGSNSAPADSKQWSDALVSADDQFRALFGEDAYFAQQLQAMRHGRAAKSTAQ